MTKARFFRNKKGDIFAFELKNHGKPIICAGVSALTLNAVNSIEAFTRDSFRCDSRDDGGYIYFEFDNGQNISNEANLLINSLLLGLNGIMEQYENSILISEEVLSC